MRRLTMEEVEERLRRKPNVWFGKGELERNFKKQFGELKTEAEIVKAIEYILLETAKIEEAIAEDIGMGYPTHSPHPRHIELREFYDKKLKQLINKLAKEHNKEHKLVKKYAPLVKE